MSATADHMPIRVLVVDEDAAVRKLLQQELTSAGYEVDTLSSGTGFTEDMVALINPDVLLVDPFIGDVPLPAVETLLLQLHQRQHLILLLIDNGRDPRLMAQIATYCGADGQIGKRHLLSEPATAVGEQLLPEAEVAPLPTVNTISSVQEELLIELEPLVARPAPKPPPAAVRQGPSRPDLLSMIQEELSVQRPSPKAVNAVVVEINLFSRHNFYVGGSGDLSTGGVFVVTNHLPALGTRVPLQLQLPVQPPLNTECLVEWIRDQAQTDRMLLGVGLSLSHLPEAQRRSLEGFFRERAPLTYLPRRR